MLAVCVAGPGAQAGRPDGVIDNLWQPFQIETVLPKRVDKVRRFTYHNADTVYRLGYHCRCGIHIWTAMPAGEGFE